MPEIPDLLHLWRDAARQVQDLAAAVAGQTTTGARDILEPLQRQSEVIEQLLRRQLDLEQQVVGRVMAPALAVAQALDATPDALRTQATAFRAAAAAFGQAADLLEVEAVAVEQAIAALKAPITLAGKGLGKLPGRGAGPPVE